LLFIFETDDLTLSDALFSVLLALLLAFFTILDIEGYAIAVPMVPSGTATDVMSKYPPLISLLLVRGIVVGLRCVVPCFFPVDPVLVDPVA
jgi:hypothetical protein